MQSILVNDKITKDKIFPLSFLTETTGVNEFIVYADNILEGITLLNDLTLDDNFLRFYGVIYEPIDQPIYIFCDDTNRFYAIKICGAYEKWSLPKEVSKIVNYVDLPDYVIYSLQTNSVILAGENTETASVGNSQWQREGRKLGAAKLGVPFIYQTFYSGRDESQNRIREPNALQVYAHLVYSVRYKTPSFVCYLENNFENSATRVRENADGLKLLRNYIKLNILFNRDSSFLPLKKQWEFKFYKHMLSYLKEVKYTDLDSLHAKNRLYRDFPVLPQDFYLTLLENDDSFISSLIDYLYETNQRKIDKYLNTCQLLDYKKTKFFPWCSYNEKPHIRELIESLHTQNVYPKTYAKGRTKVGISDLKACKAFLCEKFPQKVDTIEKKLDGEKYDEVLLLPLRIYKKSNGEMTFSADPESGEIVAFSELFSLDVKGNKIRPVVGYCIVDTPTDFSIYDKVGTKLYKALTRYTDVIVFNGKELVSDLPYEKRVEDHTPFSITKTKPKSATEEAAVVSTYLNQTTIRSDWGLCFIHTHHSSWQQLVIYKGKKPIQQKIDRVSTKVDLILQQKKSVYACRRQKRLSRYYARRKNTTRYAFDEQ